MPVQVLTFLEVIFRPDSAIINSGAVMDVIARGDQETQRIGAKCKDTSFYLRGYVRSASMPAGFCVAGYCIVLDRSPNSAVATFQNVFLGVSAPYCFPALPSAGRIAHIAHHRSSPTYQGSPTDANDKSQYVIEGRSWPALRILFLIFRQILFISVEQLSLNVAGD